MAFGSNDFPLGPNGQFPRQRISRLFGGLIPVRGNRSIEAVYRGSKVSRLPATEKEYNSSVEKAKGRMKMGSAMRNGQRSDKFRPKYMKEELSGWGTDWRVRTYKRGRYI